MKYFYEIGSKRAFKWSGEKEIRLHRPPSGWTAEAAVVDTNPITGKPLKEPGWWVVETYKGG
jgi:hypothetical protein